MTHRNDVIYNDYENDGSYNDIDGRNCLADSQNFNK